MDMLKNIAFAASLMALLAAGTPPALQAEDLAKLGADITLDDGTRQDFTILVDDAGIIQGLELRHSPKSAENLAVAAILIASIADGKPGHVLHLRLLPKAAVGEDSSWNATEFVKKAVLEERFPAAIPPYGRLTVQFLKNSGDIVGPPLSAGTIQKLSPRIPRKTEDSKFASTCGGFECFEKRFAKCKSETLTVTYAEDKVYEYEILGKAKKLCEVRAGYLSHPNSEWVGQEMSCLLDRKKPFLEAVEDTTNCDGPLMKLLAGEQHP